MVRRVPATLPGHRLHVLEHPCVVADGRDGPGAHDAPHLHDVDDTLEAEGARGVPGVRGELVVVHHASYEAAIDRLDWLEGFDPADVAASLYERVAATAVTDDGRIDCWVYVAGAHLRARLDATNRIASGDWMRP